MEGRINFCFPMKNHSLLLTLLFPAFLLLYPLMSFAQQNLPAGFAPGEERLIPAYMASRAGAGRGLTTPPGLPVRTMAEWEEIQSLVITWTSYTSTLREIVRYAQEEAGVIIVCADSNSVKNYLANGGVPDNNLSFIIGGYNSVWMRDYGTNTIYGNDVDSLMLVDWIYNRPRPLDDVVPDLVATHTGLPLFSTTTPPYDLVHTGGNFTADGFGTGFSSKLVLTENSPSGQFNPTNKTEAEVDSVMKWFMGINRYIKMDVLPYDGIHHIDMHLKLLDEETILMGQYPPGQADGPQIEANLQYVTSNFNSVFGTPYKVVRIQMPPDASGRYPDQGPAWDPGDYRTYTNSVFVNKTLLVPIYEQQYDTTALRVLRESLPGYRVEGIDCNQIIQASGALHCITRAIGVADPLLISHQSLPNTTDDQNPYQVDALIKHKSGIAGATLYYTLDTSAGFSSTVMTLSNPQDDTWTGYIPAQAQGSTIFYYIGGNANSGKSQVRPIVAPQGWWKFEVETITANDPFAGVGTFTENLSLDVFPNPAAAITCVPVFSSQATDGRLLLFNVLGERVEMLFEGKIPAGDSKYFFFANELPAGTYVLVLETETDRKVKKVMFR